MKLLDRAKADIEMFELLTSKSSLELLSIIQEARKSGETSKQIFKALLSAFRYAQNKELHVALGDIQE